MQVVTVFDNFDADWDPFSCHLSLRKIGFATLNCKGKGIFFMTHQQQPKHMHVLAITDFLTFMYNVMQWFIDKNMTFRELNMFLNLPILLGWYSPSF
jgi:hypothetical protein